MLLCRRLPSITVRAHHIHHRTFFSQRVLKQADITLPGDGSVPPIQALDDANQDTSDTQLAETLERQKISHSASSAIGALAYERKRRSDPEVALGLTPDPYVQNLRTAIQDNDYYRIRTLITKIIDADQGDITIANKLHFSLLLVPLNLLPPMMVFSMLRIVTTSFGQRHLPTRLTNRIIPVILDSPPNAAQKLVDLVFPSLLFNLKKKKPQESWSGTPSQFVFNSFTFFRWLLPRSQERSVELYKVLVDIGHVPSSALQDENVKSNGNLYTLLYASSIKTCCQRGWTELGAEFFKDYLKTGEDSQTFGNDLAMELIGYLLDNPSENDLYECCNLIEQLHAFQPVPDEIIRDFYAIATRFNFPRPAERLYLFTKAMRNDKFKPYSYPLPRGRSLVWLAKDLVRDDSTRPHFESLVEEAHELHQDLSIPTPYQPHYLELVVVEGFGLIAQSLWEKWAQGTNGEFIRGSPEILVRMLRLTRSLTRKQEERLALLRKCKSPDKAQISDSKRKLDGISSFADKVLRAFITRHEPIDEADHVILTSLARAHLVLGNISDGFHCFRMLLRRMERPDIVDLNVGLTALAEYQPRAALAFASTMIQYDVEPDEITYSTIMHHAMMKDDLNLCTELALQMKKTLDPNTNFQPFYSMASASVVNRRVDTPQRQVARLKAVLEVLRIMDYPVHRFAMYPEVGRSLIRASLHYPEVAFEIWEAVYKGMPRNDLEYCNQVGLIRKALREAWNRGNMEEIKMKEMLSKLLRD